MMKWTRLQLNALPVIAIEADNAIQNLNKLLQTINKDAIHQDIQQLNLLRNSIINRIEALDRFYQQNYLDSTIPIFHMIKLKLKRAIFKVQHIYNDTIQIQLLNPALDTQMNNIPKIGESMFQKRTQTQKKFPKSNNIKMQIKPKFKSKSKSKLHNKDNILKLLQTSRREEDETNLMQEVQFKKLSFQNHSFQLNHDQQYQPLFKADSPIKVNQKNNQRNIFQIQANKQEWKKKSISPFTKKQNNNPQVLNQNRKISPSNKKFQTNNNNQIKNKPVQKQVFSTNNNNNPQISATKPNNPKVINKNQAITSNKNLTSKLKTQGEQIRISEEEQVKQDPGQFRFTIKMTKQQYANLLKMKQQLSKKIQK